MSKHKIDIVIKATDKGIKIPDDYQPTFKNLLEFCHKNRGGYLRITLAPPFKKRSTGEGSQNHHINGHVTQISNYTGEDFDVIKLEAKRKAIKYGYPTRIDLFKNTIPLSESEIDTVQAGYLIDALHEIADFLDVKLIEKSDWRSYEAD